MPSRLLPRFRSLFIAVLGLLTAVTVPGWDYEGHRIVNQLALAALPADFPAFVRLPENAERIAFLSGEPDRWRNVGDLPLKHFNSLDHYCDVEQLAEAGLTPATLSPLRYEFAWQFAAGRAANPAGDFPKIDPAKNQDHTREWPGFAPWAITEYYGKLKSAFSYLKAFEEGGTPEEIDNARADIIYLMGVMGHYVGDCAQPLHTTKHHNGWVGPNPQGYSTWFGLHSWIDGGFIGKSGLKLADLTPRVAVAPGLALPASAPGLDPVFSAVMIYLTAQHQLVEPLYVLEKAGKFSSRKNEPVQPEGRAFIEARLLTGAEMLASVWLTAYRQAGPDIYLKAQLLRRQGVTPDKSNP